MKETRVSIACSAEKPTNRKQHSQREPCVRMPQMWMHRRMQIHWPVCGAQLEVNVSTPLFNAMRTVLSGCLKVLICIWGGTIYLQKESWIAVSIGAVLAYLLAPSLVLHDAVKGLRRGTTVDTDDWSHKLHVVTTSDL